MYDSKFGIDTQTAMASSAEAVNQQSLGLTTSSRHVSARTVPMPIAA